MAAHAEHLLQSLLAQVPLESLGRAADAELLGRFAHGGDEDAFAALIARHGPMVLGVCRRALRDAGSAEDVAQAAFLVLARKAGSLRRPEALASWLHRTALHLALRHRRADARRRDREARAPHRPTTDPVDELTRRELLAAVDEEIGRMPERFRLPVVLCCLEGRTLEETGRHLDWTPGSVKGRLERGRAELRDRLARRGFAPSAACAALDALREGARAGLPAGFGTATLRAAVAFGSGTGLGGAVAAIAEGGVRGATVLTRKAVVTFLLAVGILGGGVAAVGPPARPDPAKAKPRAGAKPAPAEKLLPRVDRQGDPLPDGAVARLGTVRWRNGEEVEALAFAPDGKSLAAGSRQGVRLFDASGKVVREIRSDVRMFYSLAFSPDGKRLACLCKTDDDERSAWGRRTVRIYDLGATRKPLDYSEQGIKWAGWSASGGPLVMRHEKDAVVLRELTSGKERRFAAKDLPDRDVDHFGGAVVPAAKLLAFPDSLAAIHLWDASTGKKVGTLETKAKYVPVFAVSPDGRLLASVTSDQGDGNTLRIWDVATGKVRHSVATDQKYHMSAAFSPDGKTLATGSGSDVRFWDPTTGRERVRTKSPHAFGKPLAFSPDGKTLATTGFHSGTLHLWDVATAEPKAAPAAHTNRISSADFSPDGKRVVTSGGMDGSVIVWDPATGEPLTVIRRGGWGRKAAFSADGKSLFSSSTDDRLIVHDASTGRQLHASSLEDPARKDLRQSGVTMRISGDRKTLVTFSSGYAKGRAGADPSKLVTVWDAATRKPTYRRTIASPPVWEAVSPDLRLLAMSQGGKDFVDAPGGKPVRVEELETGEYVQGLPQLPRQTGPLSFSPDGRLLTTWSSGVPLPGGRGERAYTMKVWEVATAGEILSLPTASIVMIARVAFSADGRLMAVPAPSHEIVLWDLRRAEELQRVKGFDDDVIQLAFSPDGRRLVSGHIDSTLLVWDVRQPKPVEVRRLDAERLDRAWADLAGDPRKAFAARVSLAESPAEAVALLKKHLGPVRPVDADRLARLLADLDDDSFKAREKAGEGLRALGDRVTGALREALKQKPSPEVRKRIQALLAPVTVPDREGLRALRGAGVLEDIGTPEARAVLAALAGGLPGARLTREAKAALRRMGHASASP